MKNKNTIYIDFETRSNVNLPKEGGWNYATHPSTRITCMGYCYKDKNNIYSEIEILTDIFMIRDRLQRAIANNVYITAHNIMFEWLICKHILGITIPIHLLNCTMARSNAFNIPASLEASCKFLKLKNQKDMSGAEVMQKYSNVFYYNSLLDKNLTLLYDYCKKDIMCLMELSYSIPELTDAEREIWEIDFKMNIKGITIDTDLMNKCIDIIPKVIDKANNRIFVLTKGKIDNITKCQQIKEYFFENKIKIDSLSQKEIGGILLRVNNNPILSEILFLRGNYGLSSLAKFKKLKNILYDSMLKDFLIYNHTLTGRWSSHSFQIQNLPKYKNITEEEIAFIKNNDIELLDIFYNPELLKLISGCLRKLLIPSGINNIFHIFDFDKIELRVLFYIANETEGIEKINSGIDIYKEMASYVFKKRISLITANERSIGKELILGCGYGMGYSKFHKRCVLNGIDIDEKTSKYAVNSYRGRFKKVISFWKDIELKTLKKKEPFLVLPSGRKIYYHGLNNKGNKVYYDIGYGEVETWGGTLTENYVSGIARDILRDGIIRLSKAGYNVKFHLHDEVIIESDKNKVNQDQIEIKKILEISPTWYNSKLKVKGWYDKRYGKD